MPFANIAYTPHVLKRMRERRISQKQVEKVLAEPHKAYSSGDRMVAERRTSAGNTLRVVYLEGPYGTEQGALVITVIRIAA
jgi:predicted fused transcriptional regulator/phosphomethylpyrimidine kinase